jgi:hypothetical protein
MCQFENEEYKLFIFQISNMQTADWQEIKEAKKAAIEVLLLLTLHLPLIYFFKFFKFFKCE